MGCKDLRPNKEAGPLELLVNSTRSRTCNREVLLRKEVSKQNKTKKVTLDPLALRSKDLKR